MQLRYNTCMAINLVRYALIWLNRIRYWNIEIQSCLLNAHSYRKNTTPLLFIHFQQNDKIPTTWVIWWVPISISYTSLYTAEENLLDISKNITTQNLCIDKHYYRFIILSEMALSPYKNNTVHSLEMLH